MDATSSSPKRRAPLASIDANAPSPRPRHAGHVAIKRPADGGPRPPSPKKPCLVTRDADDAAAADMAHHEQRPPSPSPSPDCSSVFDASWATATTTLTEPDRFDASAPEPARLTREQAREKADILRLRLGLASYKLRTGQTAVPLADLQPRPLPPRHSVRLQAPAPPARDSAVATAASMAQLRHPPSQQSDARAPPHAAADDASSDDDGGDGDEDGDEDGDADDDACSRAVVHQSQAQPHFPVANSISAGAASGLLSLARGCEIK